MLQESALQIGPFSTSSTPLQLSQAFTKIGRTKSNILAANLTSATEDDLNKAEQHERPPLEHHTLGTCLIAVSQLLLINLWLCSKDLFRSDSDEGRFHVTFWVRIIGTRNHIYDADEVQGNSSTRHGNHPSNTHVYSSLPDQYPHHMHKSIPAGKTLFERKNSQKAAQRRKKWTLHALKVEASRPPSPPPPPTPPEVRPVGNNVPPTIPEEVLALPLWPLWTDEKFMPYSPWCANRWLPRDQSGMRFQIGRLMRRLSSDVVKFATPRVRSDLSESQLMPYKEQAHSPDPFHSIDNPRLEYHNCGRLDCILTASRFMSFDDYGTKSIMMIIKAEMPTTDEVEIDETDTETKTNITYKIDPYRAWDVDRQMRRRANAADRNGVINRHLYLIGWIGYHFRAYHWERPRERPEVPVGNRGHTGGGAQDEDTDTEPDPEPDRRPGRMRPSDLDIQFPVDPTSTSNPGLTNHPDVNQHPSLDPGDSETLETGPSSKPTIVPGPQPSLWRDLRLPENQRFLQQVILDAIRACDEDQHEDERTDEVDGEEDEGNGTKRNRDYGPAFPEMYGEVCETVTARPVTWKSTVSTDLDADEALGISKSLREESSVDEQLDEKEEQDMEKTGEDRSEVTQTGLSDDRTSIRKTGGRKSSVPPIRRTRPGRSMLWID